MINSKIKIFLNGFLIIGIIFCTNLFAANDKNIKENFDDMVFIPAGEFIMGSNNSLNESPVHTIYLEGFYIDIYEVTNHDYEIFLKATGYRPHPLWKKKGFDKPDQPVIGVSWEDASAYAQWKGKRLPTEAEWEKASRGSDGRKYPWGNDWEEGLCCCKSKNDVSSAVGSFPKGKSPYGCFDMAGNVWEWCQDWYSEEYYAQSPKKDPKGPGDGTIHVLRGGAYNSSPHEVRITNRQYGCLDGGNYCAGFRCAKDLK